MGKTFLALDLAHHVARGQSWHGRRVDGGRVLDLALEGGDTFENRVVALDRPDFWYLRTGVTLFGQGSDATALVAAVAHDAAVRGPWRLIVVDTLARAMGSGDENAGADIAGLVANLGHLRQATGAHIMLIHHPGKDASRGARGHSALRAAIDTEIVVKRDRELRNHHRHSRQATRRGNRPAVRLPVAHGRAGPRPGRRSRRVLRGCPGLT